MSRSAYLRRPSPTCLLRRVGVYVGRALRQLLAEKNLTQQALAERALMKRTDVNRIANDKLSVGPARLERLAGALEVSVLELSPDQRADEKGLTLLDRLEGVEAVLAEVVAGQRLGLDALASLLEKLDVQLPDELALRRERIR